MMHVFDDPILNRIAAELPVPELVSTGEVFHDIMSCLIEQQIHYRSTKRIFAKALERAEIKHLTTDNFRLLEERGLVGLKLSAAKMETINAFLHFWKSNNIDFSKLSDAEVTSELSNIKGIGQWTIDMILLYTLKRNDIFPVDDYHLKNIMVSLYGLHPTKQLKFNMNEIAKHWNNQRSLAVLYLLDWKKSLK